MGRENILNRRSGKGGRNHRDSKEILGEIEDKENELQNLIRNLKTHVDN